MLKCEYLKLICFVLITINVLKCDNDFFVSKKYDDSKIKCITNTTFALSWVSEDVKEKLDEVSSYIPQRSNSFDSEITNDYITKHYYPLNSWSLVTNPWDQVSNDIILDRRWENMKVWMTEYKDSFHKLKFTLLTNLNKNFDVPFSLRTEKEAHIFLCDGDEVDKSNCYWFMLQAFSSSGTAIRKCEKGYIPIIDYVYPEEPCKTELKRINHPDFPRYLSSEKWSHFKLTKRGNNLNFTQFYRNNYNNILNFVDEGKVIDVTHMIVHSKVVTGLWKIHQLDYIYTRNTTNVQLGPSIEVRDGMACVSMFIKMCSSCQLQLTLEKETRTYKTEQSKWTEIKFFVPNIESSHVNLFVSTIGTSDDRFWAIDKVRLCQQIEFRMIETNQKAKCQLMSAQSDLISNEALFETKFTENNCPEKTIGKFCVPCPWVYDNCNQIKICENDEIDGTKCSCSAGFKSDRKWDCYYGCDKGYYGHGCQRTCGKCHNGYCDNIDGTCDSCTNNYTGPRCDIPPEPTFTKAPEIINTSYTEATIRVSNFEITGPMDEEPLSYAIQCTKNTRPYKWYNCSSSYNFNMQNSIVIEKLEVDTKYFVRSVVTVSNGTTYMSPYIPYSTFTTKCKDITEDNIEVKASNTSAEVSFVKTTNITCSSDKYRITIDNIRNGRTLNNDRIFFDNLIPFYSYNVTVSKSNKSQFEKYFRTTEGVPEKIQELIITSKSASSVELKWQKPTSTYGELSHYIVEYQHNSYRACNLNPQQSMLPPKSLKVEKTSTVVNDLIPFSHYIFTIFAVNTKFNGNKYIGYESTLPVTKIEEQEVPEIIDIKPSSQSVSVELSQVDCEKSRGPLIIKATPSCNNQWCINHTTINYDLLNNIKIDNLNPFSDYNIELEFCRNELICYKIKKNRQFKTKTAAPYTVRDLLVYSKDSNSISLRWKPSYPPTGILSEYEIGCYFYSFYKYANTTKLSHGLSNRCKIWPEFQCIDLLHLHEGFEYTIEVSAKNQDPSDFSRAVSIKSITKKGKSEAPYDLNIIWDINNLELEWKHPNETNGAIKRFDIAFTPIYNKNYKTLSKILAVTKDTYNLTYHYKVDGTELEPSTTYSIEIIPFNDYEGQKAEKLETTPPETPSIENDPQITSSYETITIKLTPKKPRGNGDYTLLLLISDETVENKPHPVLPNLRGFRTVSECNITQFERIYSITIGNNDHSNYCNDQILNPPLKPGTDFNITVVLNNTFSGKTRSYIRSFNGHTREGLSEANNMGLLGLLTLLLIIPIAAISFRNKRQILSMYNSIKDNLFQDSSSSQEYDQQIPLYQTNKL